MAYQELTVNNAVDFITRLRTFVLGAGWIEDAWDPGVDSSFYRFVFHHADTYIYIDIDGGQPSSSPRMSAGIGFPASPPVPIDWDVLTDVSPLMGVNLMAFFEEPTPVWLFSYDNPDGSKQVFVAYQPPQYAGSLGYLSMGKVEAAYATTGNRNYIASGTAIGGIGYAILSQPDFSAQGPGLVAHLSNDSQAGYWASNAYSTPEITGGFGAFRNQADSSQEYLDNFLYYGLNSWAYRISAAEHVATTPAMFFLYYEDRTRRFLAGSIPNLRFVSSLMFDVGEITTVGADEYAIFPVTKKTAFTPSDPYAINQPGFAIRVIR